MKVNQLIVLATLLLSCAYALDLTINNKTPYCFFHDLREKETLLIQYEITGYKPEEFRMTIYDANDQKQNVIHLIQKEKQVTYNLYSPESKEYKICFQSLDNAGKILQFEFIKTEGSHDVYPNNKALQKAFDEAVVAQYSMNDMYSNLRHQLMRTEMQTKVLESTENKVKWCSVIKMVLMISITTIQIVFLTGLFKDSSPFGI